mmetsp:Transcript_34095/g.89917  ORF Transcript_34095/g.89917 Transcript_34095/m.89917 type:complete len:744 (+) Transcript_34095:38-2269(+)
MSAPICEAGGHGMLFPAGGEWELSLPGWLRGLLYGVALVYFFAGTAIVADSFMASIEQITGRRHRRVVDKGTGAIRTQRVWNETVATLSLMALGSSAPEIFLSVIDIVKNRFHFADLGCSTIVGSAAFNLFVIVAVCLMVIPAGEGREIKHLPAFYVTAFFSMIAYLWMAFILRVQSPDLVEVWEALATFLFFPLLIYVSYRVDIGVSSNSCLSRIFNQVKVEDVANDSESAYFQYGCQEVQAPVGAVEIDISVFRRPVKSERLGKASCQYHTEHMNAVPGFDYSPIEGTLQFEDGEDEQIIKVPLIDKKQRCTPSSFLLVLEDADGDTGFCPDDDGGSDAAIVSIRLQPCGPKPYLVQHLVEVLVGADNVRRICMEWKEQVVSAMYCNGSAEEHAEASCFDKIMHLLFLPWKLPTAVLMPPVCAGEGKVSFCFSLVGIAFVTACVSDLAELFGCVFDVPDIITASTFVALGTSMPDLFASISAAREDPTADASIVNVTGSNAVNVFLGLGLPWTIAAVFWSATGRTAEWESMYPEMAAKITGAGFVVESQNIGYSVGVFCFMCVLAFLLLHMRRKLVHAELGGPRASKVASAIALVGLWSGWVILLSVQTLRWGVKGAGGAESTWGTALGLSVCVAITLVAILICKLDGNAQSQRNPELNTVAEPDPLDTTNPTGIGWADIDIAERAVREPVDADGPTEFVISEILPAVEVGHSAHDIPKENDKETEVHRTESPPWKQLYSL